MSKMFFSPEPLIFSVGGGEPDRPMDTISTIVHAIDLGSDVILTNVSLTADKKLVLHSSEVFNNSRIRTSGIESYTRNELLEIYHESLPDHHNCPEYSLFPELLHVLEAFTSQRFHFIVNGSLPGIDDSFLETIRMMHAEEKVLVSASGKIIKKIRATMPDIATTFTFAGVLGFYALCKTGLIATRRHFNGDALMLPEMIGVSYIANPGVVEAARERDLRVYLLDINDENSTQRFLESGAHGLITANVPSIKGLLPACKKH